jgi:hypothetical protein
MSILNRLKQALRVRIESVVRSALSAEFEQVVKWAPSTKAAQLQLYQSYQAMVRRALPLPSICETGYRVFSQFDEDGLLLFLFALIGAKKQLFVDIGGGDGMSSSNCANLAINFGWHGLFVDGDERNIERGRWFYARHQDTWAFPPRFVSAIVTRENINAVIREAGFEGEVDLLSIDIDGNDYWVWDALECIQPRVVIIETHIEFGYHNIVVPYDPGYRYPGRHPDYHGASPVAMVSLAHSKGYRLVGANRFGFNTIYVRNGEGDDLIPEASVEMILRHPRNPERFKLFEPIKDWAYVEAGTV